MAKEIRDLEEIRSSAEDAAVRTFAKGSGKMQHVHDIEENAVNGIVEQHVHEHDHENDHGHVPAHSHGEGVAHEHLHEHEHDHDHDHDHDHGHEHSHDHDHEHSHDHDHDHGHDHGHEHSHDHGHEHGPGCCGDEPHDHSEHELAHHNASYTHEAHLAGHPDNCECPSCNSHEEYCDYCGESLAHCKCRMPDADDVKRVYSLINLDCPICAAKIEHKIKSLPGVSYAAVSFVTKQLRVSAKNPDAMLPVFQEICRSFLSYVTVVPREEGPEESKKFRTYKVDGLDCAACSIKVQDAIAAIPGVKNATLVYETGQLRVTADNYDDLLAKMQTAAAKAEDGVTITERVRAVAQKKYRTYKVDGLDCAACSVKVQDAIAAIPIVDEAVLVYETGQLRVSARSYDGLLPLMQAAADKAEEGVTITEKEQFGAAAKYRTYDVQGLDCAACATKVEDAIKAMPEVEDAVLVYATGQLRVTARSYDGLTAKLQAVTDKVEDGVTIVERADNAPVPERKKAEKKSFLSENARELFELVVGGVIFIVTEWLGLVPEEYHMYFLVVAYIILGWKIVLTALKNLTKGEFFDENFLMTVATLGAFAIQAWEEAVGVIFFYRVGEWFQDRAADRSRDQIMDAVDMRPEVVNLLVGDDVKVIPSAEARVGDILLVRVGDRIPLDGVVIEGESLLDTSPVTGEPVPVRKTYGDEVLSGCVNTSGMLKIRVEKELQESMVTKILDSVENAAANKPYIDKFITRFARVYTPIVVGLAILVAVVPSLITGDWHKWIYTALTFLVISCPCALVLSVPLSFFAGIGAGSKLGILFKGGNAMEMLKNVAAVVMDKTGTVTKGNFVLQQVNPAGSVSEDEILRETAGMEQVSTHPIAVSIVNAAKEKNLTLQRPDRFEEIAGEGLVAYYGKDVLLAGNTRLMNRYKIDFSGYKAADYGSEVLVAKNGTYLGSMLIRDTLKDDAKQAVADITKLGLTTVMLTGDARKEAEAVAKEAGIQEVRAELLPQDKLNEMNNLRNKFGGVMFVGDGINDAPVLAGADVGAAMGSGADAAIEAADVVFMNSEMSAIPKAIAIAKAVNSVAWQNVAFALVVKVIIMVAGLFGYASMWAAVFADTGVSVLCVLNACRVLYKKF